MTFPVKLIHLSFSFIFSFILIAPVFSLTAEEDNQFRHHINTGNRKLAKRLYKEAIYEYEQALKISPDSRLAKDNIALVHNNWGTESFNRRKFDEARMHWEIALKINPNNPIARENLRTLDIHIRNAQARERRRQRMMEEYGDEEDEEEFEEPIYPDPRKRKRGFDPGDKTDPRHEERGEQKQQGQQGQQKQKKGQDKDKAEAKEKPKKPPAVVIIKKSSDPAISDLNLILGSDEKEKNLPVENPVDQNTPPSQSTPNGEPEQAPQSSGDPFAPAVSQTKGPRSQKNKPENNTNIDTMIQNSIDTLENSRNQKAQSKTTGNTKPVKKTIYSTDSYPNTKPVSNPVKKPKEFEVVKENSDENKPDKDFQEIEQKQVPEMRKDEPSPSQKSSLTLFEKLTKLEKMVFGKTREKEPIIKRLEQLEKDTLGEKQSGPVKKRIEKLTKTYGI